MKNKTQMTVNELIKKWKLPNAWCARIMGIKRNSFNNKIHERNQYCYFKKEESDKLIKFLKELSKDLEVIG
jgi:predicted XRE-type DNA-binding protein